MSKDQPVYLTKDGLQKVKEELEYLTTTRRKEVAKMIGEAIAEGDLRENAGYDEAKNAQGFLEGRIRELEEMLKRVQLIDSDGLDKGTVALGRTVVVCEVGTDFEETYMIVGAVQADPTNGRISNESPMGKSLLNKKVGDKATVESPGGEIEFEIVKIE